MAKIVLVSAKRRWTRVWWAMSAVSLMGGLSLATWWLLARTGGADGAGIANVLALPASVVSAVLSVASAGAGRRSRSYLRYSELWAHARTLLGTVAVVEARALANLLGDVGDPRPADLGLRSEEGHWRSDGDPHSGSLTTIADDYKKYLRRSRLVVVGEPGSGKTVTVLRLLLDLVSEAQSACQAGEPRIRVPVRLSLSAFPHRYRRSMARAAGERLDSWICGQLVEVYGLPAPIARALLDDGWLLPILDGLDEMDADTSEFERAKTILAALNRPVPVAWPVVLTCRSERYRKLAKNHGVALVDAVTVEVEPLEIDQVIGWLSHRFPDPSAKPDRVQSRWRRVITTLRRHPKGQLATCLTKPLMLYVAVTVYRDPRSEPREMCNPERNESSLPRTLKARLFDQLVPAIVAHHPRRNGTYYNAEEVTRWLRSLAKHLAWMGENGHSSVDLHLHHLWRTTGNPPGRAIRFWAAALTVAVIALPVLVFVVQSATFTGFHPPTTARGWIAAFGIVILLGWIFQHTSSPTMKPPQRLEVRLALSVAGRRKLAEGLMKALKLALPVGLGLGLAFGIAVGLPIGLPVGLTAGVTIGLVFGVTGGLTAAQMTASQPSDPMRQALTWDLVRGVVAWLAGGAIGWLTGRFAMMFTDWKVVGLTSWWVGWLSIGLAFALAVGLIGSPGPLYALTVWKLRRSGELPGRPGQFLDWAHNAGLVRVSGAAVQFRHSDLQEFLLASADAGVQARAPEARGRR
ncbi:NACHT domain-containing protein [Amycolatopsis sp. OK19-0408]|uniref:NACHT domain-containing protein n=1 Tax=Amycolatopsis iheyensis TaxID=2945988 RepID=A0A9X2NII3_9PSEU|nr:NACHT domain-containing protein [Amycolatopsis iheyensis]MCR6488412.1 NACHT domain-containing protein [Amycolatopsis iheyensis]